LFERIAAMKIKNKTNLIIIFVVIFAFLIGCLCGVATNRYVIANKYAEQTTEYSGDYSVSGHAAESLYD